MIKVLTTEKFHDQRRERLMRYDNYFEEADHICSRVPRARHNLTHQEWLAKKVAGQKMMVTSAVAGGSVGLLALGYCAGANLADLRAFYPAVLVDFARNSGAGNRRAM
jgi:hypothetical protein